MKKILASDHAPYRDKSLKDLKGEKWSEIEGLEGYYLISNLGRVKSLPRLVEVFIPKQQRSIAYYTKEKILTVKVHEKINTVIGKPYYECTVSVRFGGAEKTFLISRLVYHAFVNKIDFEKDRLMIMHKDANGLNNYYKNLEAGTRSEVTHRAYKSNRHVSPFALKSKKDIKDIAKRAALARQKPVWQYSLKGRKIRRFESIKEASMRTGIADSGISRVLKRQGNSAGGFIWKYDFKK